MSQKTLSYAYDVAAKYLYQGLIGGFARGAAEARPRALGNRSILVDERSIKNKDRIMV